MVLERARCRNHPERFGHALCMACRKTLCQECATEWDGIFFCSPCLQARRKTAADGAGVVGWILVAAAAILLFFAGPSVLVWGSTVLQRGFAS